MKIFDAHFFSGTLLTGLGLTGLIAGIIMLIPPITYGATGVILILIGAPLTILGYKFAKNSYPVSSRTAVDTLRKAGMLDKNHKKQ